MAPDGTQQRGVWSHRECQHDRKDSCSEHGDARQSQGQDPRHPSIANINENVPFFESVRRLTLLGLRNFAGRCRKFPNAARPQP